MRRTSAGGASTFGRWGRRAVAVGAVGGLLAGATTAAAAPRPRLRAEAPAAPVQASKGAKPMWTYLVYANGDNNLEVDLLQQIEDMTKAKFAGKVNVVVLMDRSAEGYAGPYAGIPDSTGAQLLELHEGKAEVLQDVGEIDMGQSDTLAWFLQEGLTRFPAQHYALSIMDHGGAWVGASQDEGPPATGPDDASLMRLKGIAEGLRKGEAAAGVDRLDLLVFAACLMGNYEVSRALAPYAKLMVADEEEALSSLFAQDEIVDAMAAGPSPEALARTFVDNYASVIKGQAQAWQDVQAFSVIDLDRIDRVRRAVASLQRALIADMDTMAPILARARASTLTFGQVDTGSEDNFFQTVDLGNLLEILDTTSLPADVAAARGAVEAAIKAAITYEVRGRATAQALGLSIFFPSDFAAQARAFASYKKQISAEEWAPALDAFADATASESGGNLALDGDPQLVHVGTDGVLLEGKVTKETESKLAKVNGLWGVIDSQGAPKIFLKGPAVLDAGEVGTIQSSWAYQYIRLSDGKTTAPGTVYLQQQEDVIRGAIPVIYRKADGTEIQADVLLSLDGQLNPSFGGIFTFSDAGGSAQLTPEPGSVIVPQLSTVVNGEFTLVPVPGGELTATGDLTAIRATLPSKTEMVGYLDLVGNDGNSRAYGIKTPVP